MGSGDEMDRFGELLRTHRRSAGLTQKALADLIGLSVAAIRDLEQGRRSKPRSRTMALLAETLDLDASVAQTPRTLGQASAVPAGAGPARRSARRTGLWLQALGSLEAWRDGCQVDLGPPRQRTVLGQLALNPDCLVHRETIIDVLWGEDPPAAAANLVQAYVSRLRRAIEPHRAPGAGAGLLSSSGGGYRLRVSAGQLDLLEFRRLCGLARASCVAGDQTSACRWYEKALGMWHGPPVGDLELLRGHPAVIGLNSEQAVAIIEYAEVASGAGWHERALPRLRTLAAADPLNEKAHAQLMIALSGCGYQAAALEAFDGIRRRLDDHLGIEPGRALSEARMRVLRQEILVPDVPHSVTTAGVVPRQLPGAIRHFAGRGHELETLSSQLSETGQAGGTVVISAIHGTAGVGKTALAIYWAHQVAEHFPDGQLYVNLRGYDPDTPMTAADALAGFLRALGARGQDIPEDECERAARYRSLLAGQRVLVVLDNASSVEQVRPLLPGTPACAAVVTSRDSLAGLVARDGALRLDLDLLSPEDAVGLLRHLIGARVDADLPAAGALAAECSRLPLALRLAAELAVARPAASLADLVAELADEPRRLDLMDAAGDARTALRTVFSWSYRHLDVDAARAFRLIGLQPGPDLDRHAAAALAQITAERADHVLDKLARAHLIHTTGPGRYGLHDLLRAYARELVATQDSEEARRAALTSLFDHYLHTAATAVGTLFPAERHHRPDVSSCVAPGPELADSAAALAWLDAERANLVASAAHTAVCGWPGHSARLSATLFRYLETGGYYSEADTIHSGALHAAQGSGDLAAEATALTNLGLTDFRRGRCQEAVDHLQQGLELFHETRNRSGEARALNGLSLVDFQQGRCQQAIDLQQRVLGLFREIGDLVGEARALGNLGLLDVRQGRWQQAASRFQQALGLFRETGDRAGETYTLASLGDVDLRQGRYQQATDHLQQALVLARDAGDRIGEANVLTNLGLVDLQQGRYQQATGRHHKVLALYREFGDRIGEAKALNGLGEIFLAIGQPDEASIRHTTALDVANNVGDPNQQARAHRGLARSYHATGDPDGARHHWRQAHILYTHLGAPEADQVRNSLLASGDVVLAARRSFTRAAGQDGPGRGP